MKKTLSKLIKNYSKANWKLIILHSAGSLSFFQLNLTRCIGQRVLAFGFAYFFCFFNKNKIPTYYGLRKIFLCEMFSLHLFNWLDFCIASIGLNSSICRGLCKCSYYCVFIISDLMSIRGYHLLGDQFRIDQWDM